MNEQFLHHQKALNLSYFSFLYVLFESCSNFPRKITFLILPTIVSIRSASVTGVDGDDEPYVRILRSPVAESYFLGN